VNELLEPATDPVVKVCRSCNISRPIEQFYKDASAKDGHKSSCKDCCDAQNKRQKRKYTNFNQQNYDELFIKLRGQCPVSRRPFDENGAKAHLDHDHQSEAVRGIIAANVNAVLGFAQDDPATLRRATNYLLGAQIYSLGLVTPFLSMPEFILKFLQIMEGDQQS
jgi:hypothetical protein